MKKKLLFISCLLFCTILFSQKNLQGRVYYTFSIDFGSEKKIDSLTKKATLKSKKTQNWLKDILKRKKDVTGILEFANGESLYKIEDEMKNDAKKILNLTKIFAGSKSKYYTNTTTKNHFRQRLVDEPLRIEMKPQKWKITQESKMIGDYLCFKAISIKEVETRKGKRSKTTIAWFTPQINANIGPKDYFGLPGLILLIQEDKTTISATRIELNPNPKIKIKKPTKGKKITQKEYSKMSRDFIKNIAKRRKRN